MKFRKLACDHCGFEGKPVKGTAGRVKHKGMTIICPSCRGPVSDS